MKGEQVNPGDIFLEHFARYERRIRAYTYALVQDHQACDDVFQTTALVLWRKFEQFDPESSFLAWAFRVAYLEARGYHRSKRRDRLRFNENVLNMLADEGSDRYARRNDRREALQHCLRKLNRSDRQLVAKNYGGNQTVKDLAERMGRSVQTLYNRLSRIRQQLFECVEKRLAETEV
jgi:RNA polymerase sigma-70 factor (ECF subfamily)